MRPVRNRLLSITNAARQAGAIFVKSALEFIRYPANMLFDVLMPLVWFVPTYFLIITFAPDGTSAGLDAWVGQDNFFTYLPVGLVVMYVISAVFWNIGFALKRLMDIGMLETIWACPISRPVFVVGESLFSMVKLVVELVVVMVVYRFLFGFTVPRGFLAMIPWFVPFVALMYGFGIGFAALVLLFKDAGTMVDTSSFLVQGLTGTQNPPQVFPPPLLAISLAIPITYFVDFLRVRTLGITPLVSPVLEQVIILGSAVVFPAAGLLMFRLIDRRVRMRGTIHVH